MIHVKAPNGLLGAVEPYPEGPCGVGWTSTPSEARSFDGPASALLWAKVHAPDLAVHIQTALDRPAGAAWIWPDLRFSPVEGCPS